MTLAFQINTEIGQSLRNRVASGCCGSKKIPFLLYFTYSFCAPIKRSIFVAISAYNNSDIERDRDARGTVR